MLNKVFASDVQSLIEESRTGKARTKVLLKAIQLAQSPERFTDVVKRNLSENRRTIEKAAARPGSYKVRGRGEFGTLTEADRELHAPVGTARRRTPGTLEWAMGQVDSVLNAVEPTRRSAVTGKIETPTERRVRIKYTLQRLGKHYGETDFGDVLTLLGSEGVPIDRELETIAQQDRQNRAAEKAAASRGRFSGMQDALGELQDLGPAQGSRNADYLRAAMGVAKGAVRGVVAKNPEEGWSTIPEFAPHEAHGAGDVALNVGRGVADLVDPGALIGFLMESPEMIASMGAETLSSGKAPGEAVADTMIGTTGPERLAGASRMLGNIVGLKLGGKAIKTGSALEPYQAVGTAAKDLLTKPVATVKKAAGIVKDVATKPVKVAKAVVGTVGDVAADVKFRKERAAKPKAPEKSPLAKGAHTETIHPKDKALRDKRIIESLEADDVKVEAPEPDAKPVGETKYKYGNTQADIPEKSEAGAALKSVREAVDDADVAGDGKDVGGSHITVRYGIDGDDIEGIARYLRSKKPFEVSLGKTESFPPSPSSDGAAVLIAGIDSPELRVINEEISKHGKFIEPTFKEYKPHATIAYVKPESVQKYVGGNATEGKKFSVDQITISDRQGNKHVVKLEGAESAVTTPPKDVTPEPPTGEMVAPPKKGDAEAPRVAAPEVGKVDRFVVKKKKDKVYDVVDTETGKTIDSRKTFKDAQNVASRRTAAAASPEQAAPSQAGESFSRPPVGDVREVSTPDYKVKAKVVPKIVSIDDVIESHDAHQTPNPRYPFDEGLQPRMREGQNYAEQIRNIASDLDPDRFGALGTESDRGVPIVDKRGVVISGNGRTASARLAIEQYGPKWAAYQEWLKDKFPNADIPKDKGILVYEFVDDIDLDTKKAFAEKSNISSSAKAQVAEQAVIDTGNLPKDWLDRMDYGGKSLEEAFEKPVNRKIVDDFFDQVPDSERTGYKSVSGDYTPDAYKRVANAALADMLGPEARDLINRHLGDAEFSARVIAGLQQSTPWLARVVKLGRGGDAMASAFQNTLVEALKLVDEFKRQTKFKKPELYFEQGTMLEAARDALAVRLAVNLLKGKSQSQISGMLGGISSEIMGKAEGLFTDEFGGGTMNDVFDTVLSPYEFDAPHAGDGKGLGGGGSSLQSGFVDPRLLAAVPLPILGFTVARALGEDQESSIYYGLGAMGLALATAAGVRGSRKLFNTPLGQVLRGESKVIDTSSGGFAHEVADIWARTFRAPLDYAKARADGFGIEIDKIGRAYSVQILRSAGDHAEMFKAIEDTLGKKWHRDPANKEKLNALGEKQMKRMAIKMGEEIGDLPEYEPWEKEFLARTENLRERHPEMFWEAGGAVPIRYKFRDRNLNESPHSYQEKERANQERIFWHQVKKGIVGHRVRFVATLEDGAKQLVEGRVIGVRDGKENIRATVAKIADKLIEDEPNLNRKDAMARASEIVNEQAGPFGMDTTDPYYLVRSTEGSDMGGIQNTFALPLGKTFAREVIQFGEDFFPKTIKADFLEQLMDESFRKKSAERLAERNPQVFGTTDEALQYLTDISKEAVGDRDIHSFMANLETERRVNLLPEMYESDYVKAWSKYIDKATKRIALAESLGTAEPGELGRILNSLELPDKKYFEELIGRTLRLGPAADRTAAETLAGLEAGFQSASKLTGGTTHIAQLNDIAYVLTRAGIKDIGNGLIDSIKSHWDRESLPRLALFMEQRGALREVFGDSPGMMGVDALPADAGKLERTAVKMQRLSDRIHAFSGLRHLDREVKTGIMAAGLRDLHSTLEAFHKGGSKTRKLVGGDAAGLRRKLENYGLSNADIETAKTYGTAILDNELVKARVTQRIRQDLLYTGSAMDNPLWMSSPAGAVFMRFKKPLYVATRFMLRDVLREAGHGNIKPLAKALVVGGVGAEVLTQLKDLIKGRDNEGLLERLQRGDIVMALERFVENMGSAGTLGALYEYNPFFNEELQRRSAKDWLTDMAKPVSAVTIQRWGALGVTSGKDAVKDAFGTPDDKWWYERMAYNMDRALKQEFVLLNRLSNWTGESLVGRTSEAGGHAAKVFDQIGMNKLAGVFEGKARSVPDFIQMQQLDRKRSENRVYNKLRGLPEGKGRKLSVQETRDMVRLKLKYPPNPKAATVPDAVNVILNELKPRG